MSDEKVQKTNFIHQIIDGDLDSGKNGDKVVTRFPPEPNGFLHIGHAKSICLNFGIAKKYPGAKCHLRFDDTNPEKEDEAYVEAIKEDVKWLGFEWDENLFHASDYFPKLYNCAVELIKKSKAYVCELNAEQMREYRGSLKEPGKESPFRNRSIVENLELFEKMKNGEVEEGAMTLRAKIDMSSPNVNMRDPIIYRIRKVEHQRTGNEWCIYPMYDFTHCLSDSFEGITHSVCTLEFEDHRPLYDWVLDTLETPCHPQQIEFARLNLEYTVMSKRRLLQLVEEKHVGGWDDPRMPTISGMRRRGYLPESIVNFCEQIGVTKKDSSITMGTLEANVRDALGPICPRYFGVVSPLAVTITNLDDEFRQNILCDLHPKDESAGKRDVPFSNKIYIEQDDFMEDPPKKFFRLGPGRSARLKYAYVITCDEVIKDDSGKVVELKCTYHKDTFGGVTPEGMKKVKGIINWVDARSCLDVEVRLYDRLFTRPNPMGDKSLDFKECINPDSLKIIRSKVEPALANIKEGERVQFERQGYFVLDKESTSENTVFNRIITLKDTWAKFEKELSEQN